MSGELVWGVDLTGNRAAKVDCVLLAGRTGGSETIGAAKHAAMEKLRMIAWKFCRG